MNRVLRVLSNQAQAILSSLLEECFEIAQEIKAREDTKNVPFGLKPVYDRLSEMRAELENLVLTRRWSLRETDLYNYTVSLQEIDKMRVDGKFVDAEGNRPAGQYVSSCIAGRPGISCGANINVILATGPFILAETMLWSNLPSLILE